MKKTILLLTLSLIALSAAAQDLPRLRPIKEKQLHETIFPTQRKEKWGYANEKGKFLIKAVFDEADFFRDVHIGPTDTVALARVRFEGKWGILSRDGTFLLDPCFDELRSFDQEVAIFKDKGYYGLLSYTGEVLREGLQELEDFLPDGMAWYKENGRWGVMKTDGTDLFPCIYSSKPTEKLSPSLLLTEVDGLFGIIALSKGKTILAPECEGIDQDRNDPSLLVYQRSGRLGCLRSDGTLIAPPQYDSIASLSTGGNREILIKKEGRYGKLSSTGKELIPPVMETNQLSAGNQLCQFFRNGEPWVYYKDKPYNIQQFDDLLYGSVDHTAYLSMTDNLRFPVWMRRHVFEEMDYDERENRWREDNPFSLFSEDTKYQQKKFVRYPEESPYVAVGKDMKVMDYEGVICSYDAPLSSVAIEADGVSFPFGAWLTTLFRSIDTKKINMFDQVHGTSVLEFWNSLTFRFPVMAVSKGKLVLVTDMYIGGYHVQRILTSLSAKGSPVFTVKEDGVLYTDNAIDDDMTALALVDDNILFLTERGDRIISTLYTAAGKKLITMDNFFALYSFVSDSDYLFLGITERGASMQRYGRNGAALRKDDNLQFFGTTLDSDNLIMNWISIADGRFLVSVQETGLLCELVNMDTPRLRTPVMRYAFSRWDGQPVVAVSKNYWDYMGESVWQYVPGPGQRDRAFQKQIGDVQFNVSEETGDNGIAVYSVKYAEEGDDALRYGYIGFETPFFTAPVFEEARTFSAGTAEVKIHGEWLQLSMDDLGKYTSDPRGAIDPQAGHPLFDM